MILKNMITEVLKKKLKRQLAYLYYKKNVIPEIFYM
jgi:hypothetical protein